MAPRDFFVVKSVHVRNHLVKLCPNIVPQYYGGGGGGGCPVPAPPPPSYTNGIENSNSLDKFVGTLEFFS